MTIVRDRHSSKSKKGKNKLKSIMEVKRLSINELIEEEEPEKENEKEEEIDISLIEKAHIFKNENFMGFPFCWCRFLRLLLASFGVSD